MTSASSPAAISINLRAAWVARWAGRGHIDEQGPGFDGRLDGQDAADHDRDSRCGSRRNQGSTQLSPTYTTIEKYPLAAGRSQTCSEDLDERESLGCGEWWWWLEVGDPSVV